MGIYAILVRWSAPYLANIISASVGMVANFTMQWLYVFRATRTWYASFIFSMIFSVIGIFIGSSLVYFLTTETLLSSYPMYAKCITVAFVFFYNFFTKKFSFGD